MKKFKSLISITLSLLMLLSVVSVAGAPAYAADSSYQLYNVNVVGTYGQTEARDMLPLINAFRTGTIYEPEYTPELEDEEIMHPGTYTDRAWYRNPDGSKNTSKIGTLCELQYDYGLEKIAMQRAAEIAVMFEHQRPNGDALVSTDRNEKITGVPISGPLFEESAQMAENIASGQKTKEGAMKFWREKDEDYDNQGHRRSMLSFKADYKYVGIAHFIMNGVDYWVQEFSVQPFSLEETQARDENDNVPVQIRSDYIEGAAYPSSHQQVNPYVGDSVILPQTLPASIFYKHQFPNDDDAIINIEFTLNWNVPQNEYVRLEDGKLIALKEGKYTVTGTTASGASLSLDLVITQGCNHNYVEDRRKEASCTAEGYIRYQCTVCGEYKTDIFPKLSHSYEEVSRTEPTCTKNGQVTKVCSECGDTQTETLDMLAHEYGEPEVETEATCTAEGTEIYTCKNCGRRLVGTIPKKEHNYITTEYPASCTKEGRIEKECSVCHDKQTQTLEKLPHNWEEKERTEASYSAAGTIIYQCSNCGEYKTVTDPDRPKLKKNGWFNKNNQPCDVSQGARYYTNDVYVRHWQDIDGKRYWFDDNGYRIENVLCSIDNDPAIYYFDANGVMHTGWLTMKGNKFYFDSNGAMATGWRKIGSNSYYFNASGVMLTGWQKIGGKQYLFAYADGRMLTGWVNSGSKRFYFDANGVMVTGWRKIGGKQYLFAYADGRMLKGWVNSGGKRFYFDTNGVMVTGWRKIGGKQYLFAYADGRMLKGWVNSGGKRFYFDGNGVMVTGWRKIGGKQYLFAYADGRMLKGWVNSGGKRFYFDGNGVMVTGWRTIGGKRYLFAYADGRMLTGWVKSGGKWYYFNAGGDMVTGNKRIGNKTYRFNSAGVCLNR